MRALFIFLLIFRFMLRSVGVCVMMYLSFGVYGEDCVKWGKKKGLTERISFKMSFLWNHFYQCGLLLLQKVAFFGFLLSYFVRGFFVDCYMRVFIF